MQWQAAAFKLPATQQEASGWWDAPPWLSRLCPQDFMPITDTSGLKDFQVIRQEKTLALVQALQACTEVSGARTGVLCDSAQELQRCMAPLMTLSGDNIVEASLLKHTGEEHGRSPTLEEVAALLGKDVKLPEVLGSLPECPEIPMFVEPAEQITAPSASPSLSSMPQPCHHPSQ